MKIIPNTITLLNLLCGFLALVCAASPLDMFDTFGNGSQYPAYIFAFSFIALAAVADFLDGLSARILGSYSPLGKQLDSLSDMVSFGVAPAFLLFNLMLEAGAPLWSRLLCLLIPACGALRLGRFNLDTTQTHSFKGLPIPGAAIFCIGLAAIMANEGVNLYACCGCIVAAALLMVVPVRMYSFKLTRLLDIQNLLPLSLVTVTAFCAIKFGWEGLFWSVVYYILTSFIFSSFTVNRATGEEAEAA